MSARVTVRAGQREVSLSSPDKELVHGVTKLQLAEHWQLVGEMTVAAVGGRLISAKRAPDGPDGDAFFQKNAPKGLPRWITTAGVPRERDDETVNHVVLEDVAHILALVQHGTVEVHVTTWDVIDPWMPRELLLDLDPPPDAEVSAVRSALRHTLALLDDLGLGWRVKTTGSKGFHVHVPLVDVDTELARDTSSVLAGVLAARHPDELTTEFHIADRKGRVFVDWLRNGGGATAIAPWSPRIRDGGPVAVPLHPDEVTGNSLDDVRPDAWRVTDIPARLDQAGDVWAELPPATDLRDAIAALSDGDPDAG